MYYCTSVDVDLLFILLFSPHVGRAEAQRMSQQNLKQGMRSLSRNDRLTQRIYEHEERMMQLTTYVQKPVENIAS